MRYIKRIAIIVVVIVLIFSLTAPCFSAGLAFTAFDIVDIGWEIYASSHGMGSYFTTNGTINNPSNPFNKSALQGLWDALYSEYQDFDSNIDYIELFADYAWSQMTFYSTPVDGSDILHLGITLSDQLVEWYDNFANWLLDKKMGVPSDSGTYHTSGSFSNNIVSSYSSVKPQVFYEGGGQIGTCDSGNGILSFGLTLPTFIAPCYAFQYKNNGDTIINIVVGNGTTTGNSSYLRFYCGGNNIGNKSLPTRRTYSELTALQFTAYVQGGNWGNYTLTIPEFDSYSDGMNAISSASQSVEMSLAPKQKVRDDGGDIYIPQPLDPDYVPEAINGTTNLPYNPSNTKEQNADLIQQKLLENTDVLNLTDSFQPEPVISPYVPFINLPNFNFNFAGIWHYVVEWLGSMSSGIMFIGNIWSNIPYAIVVPIYATAVVLIVTSIFKRFV